jgi:hypothetical protein
MVLPEHLIKREQKEGKEKAEQHNSWPLFWCAFTGAEFGGGELLRLSCACL